jgi:hypothetical protein
VQYPEFTPQYTKKANIQHVLVICKNTSQCQGGCLLLQALQKIPSFSQWTVGSTHHLLNDPHFPQLYPAPVSNIHTNLFLEFNFVPLIYLCLCCAVLISTSIFTFFFRFSSNSSYLIFLDNLEKNYINFLKCLLYL